MSEELKLSPWHDSTTTPVRVGVYEVDKLDPAFAYWDGEKFGYRWWVFQHMTREDAIVLAMQYREWDTALPERTTWRGILK